MILPDSPESVKMLLEYGHPVDLLDYEGNSALNSATSSNALDSMQILVAAGADRER
jgi:ankyrin repeat protein